MARWYNSKTEGFCFFLKKLIAKQESVVVDRPTSWRDVKGGLGGLAARFGEKDVS